jgi:hypothetical protein
VAENNTPFLCPCNSSGLATSLFLSIIERFPNKNILLLTLDTSTGERQTEFIKAPNQQANKYEGIIFSPVIESGVSIDNERFQEIIGFCATGERVGTPDAFVQMLLRGRKAKRLSVFVEPQRFLLPEQEIDCITEIVSRFNLVANQIKEHSDKVFVDFELTESAKLAIKVEVLKNKLKNQTSQSVYDFLTKRMGCSVNLIREKYVTGEGHEVVKEGLKMKKERFRNKVSEALKIDKLMYDQLHKKRTLAYDEYWAIKRHELETELCLNLDEIDDLVQLKELFVFWAEGRIMRNIHAFETATLSKEQAIAIAEYFLREKAPDDQVHEFFLQWIIWAGIMESFQLSYSNGILKFNPDLNIVYNNLRNEWWHIFARENVLAVNAANLGARINTELTNKIVGNWVMAIGVKVKRKRARRTNENNYFINIDDMSLFLDVIKRRHDNQRTKYHSLLQQLTPEKHTEVIQDLSLSSICDKHNKKYSKYK